MTTAVVIAVWFSPPLSLSLSLSVVVVVVVVVNQSINQSVVLKVKIYEYEDGTNLAIVMSE